MNFNRSIKRKNVFRDALFESFENSNLKKTSLVESFENLKLETPYNTVDVVKMFYFLYCIEFLFIENYGY